MLQPLQLQDIERRYPSQIAELHGFLASAGIPTGTAEALRIIPATLRQDRAFHRDLTSHLWLLMEEGTGYPSSTLLGILAVAAADSLFATGMETGDAHALLRFVMEARRSFESPAGANIHAAETAPLKVSSPPLEVVLSQAQSGNLPPAGSAFLEERPTRQSRTRRLLWVAAACVLLAVSAGAWLWLRPSPARQVAIVTPPPAEHVPLRPGTRAADGERNSAPKTSASYPAAPLASARRGNMTTPSPTIASPSAPQQQNASPLSNREVASAPPPAFTWTSRTPAATSNAAPIVRPGTAGPSTAIPAATLSKRLGARTVPPYASTEDESVTRRHPRLLRHQTSPQLGQDQETDALLAESTPADSPMSPSPGAGTPPANGVRTGTVRPVSLGMMAANVLYSPAPAYPAAASAANVQGEVKVQARIDPSGNVASARVISGPPLLRDAALGAVQHWRYKPFMASGRPVATSTIAVVDFQLP